MVHVSCTIGTVMLHVMAKHVFLLVCVAVCQVFPFAKNETLYDFCRILARRCDLDQWHPVKLAVGGLATCVVVGGREPSGVDLQGPIGPKTFGIGT